MTASRGQAQVAAAAPALRVCGVGKRYGATRALQDVSVDFNVGEILAITGENGAGKSTLIRIITGLEQPDVGSMLRSGRALNLHSRHDAAREGIFCVYQDQPFVGTFHAYKQMFLGYEQWFRRHGVMSDTRMRAACAEIFAELGLTSVSPMSRMGEISPGGRTLVAVATVIATARLLEVDHPVILLDEPTSALSAGDIPVLAELLDALKARSALAFVSHRMTEVLEWSDSIWVLRDGRNTDSMRTAQATEARIHIAMGGRVTAAAASTDVSPEPGGHTGNGAPVASQPGSGGPGLNGDRARRPSTSVYSIQGARLPRSPQTLELDVAHGEIVTLAGVEGSGKEEFLQVCFGLLGGGDDVEVRVGGQPCRRSPRPLQRAGVAYLSGERHRAGVFNELSIAENIAIAERVRAGWRGWLVSRSREQRKAAGMIDELSIKAAGTQAAVRSLSGGNQQKVLLGRCLAIKPTLLILDNVTRGIDIAAKASIYELLRRLAASGVAIVLASDDLDEVVALGDRVVVFRRREMVRVYDDAPTSLEVLACMV